MNNEQTAKIMENAVHGLLIKNLRTLCEKITADKNFTRLYSHDSELYKLNKLRKEFTDCYQTMIAEIKDDFTNCELSDFKNLCFLGLKVTSQLIKIDYAITRFMFSRELEISRAADAVFFRVKDILDILDCPLSEQEIKILENARMVKSLNGNKIASRLLETNNISLPKPKYYECSPYGKI